MISYLLDILFSFFIKGFQLDRDIIVFNSTENIHYNFNSQFLFESMILHENFSRKKIYFVINDKAKRNKLNHKFPGRFISSRSMRGRMLCLKSKIWITSTIEAPVYGLSKHADRIVYHLGHGIPLKNIGLAECDISIIRKINRKLRVRLFTHVTCYSPMFDDFFKRVFDNHKINLLHFGQPRNDSLYNNTNLEDAVSFDGNLSSTINVLYSPTWRPYSITKFFPFEDFSVKNFHDFLNKENIRLFVREHPYFKADIPDGLFDSSMVINLNSDVINDITPYLNNFHCLVTDYSSIYLDFLTLRKMVIYLPYDIVDYSKTVGFSVPYKDMICGSVAKDYQDFLSALKASKKYSSNSKRNLFLNDFNLKASGNCQEHLLYIEKLLNEN